MAEPQRLQPDRVEGPARADPLPSHVDERLFRNVMGLFATGITVVTTKVDGRTFGMTANAFMAGSLDPPLCVVSVGNDARLHEQLRISGRYGVSFLSEEQQYLSNHFAGRRLAGLQPEFTLLGETPVLSRAVAVVAAEIADTADCGDHTLFIGRITWMQAASGPPLLFYGGRYARIDSSNSIEAIHPPTFW